MRVRFATYNTYNLGLDSVGDRAGLDRFAQVAQVIRGLGADVVAVQEILSDNREWARSCLQRLATLAGMTCVVEPGWADKDDAQDAEHALGFGGTACTSG